MFRRSGVLAGLFITGFVGIVPAQTTWYVDNDAPNDPGPGDPTVSDPNEDGSAAHPFDAIQEAVSVAGHGDAVLVLDEVPQLAALKHLQDLERLIARTLQRRVKRRNPDPDPPIDWHQALVERFGAPATDREAGSTWQARRQGFPAYESGDG